MPKDKKRVYHGWIVVEKGGEGYLDYFICEEKNQEGQMLKLQTFRDPAEAVNWWDERVGKQIKLQNTPLGAYRVFTEEE